MPTETGDIGAAKTTPKLLGRGRGFRGAAREIGTSNSGTQKGGNSNGLEAGTRLVSSLEERRTQI